MRATAAAILVVAGLTANCSSPATPTAQQPSSSTTQETPSGGGNQQREPLGESATMRPDLIAIDPSSVRPGETAALSFPANTRRGQAFTLELSVDGSWEPQRYLISAPSSFDTADGPSWSPTARDSALRISLFTGRARTSS